YPRKGWTIEDASLADLLSVQQPGVDRTGPGLKLGEIGQAAGDAEVIGRVHHGLNPQRAAVFQVRWGADEVPCGPFPTPPSRTTHTGFLVGSSPAITSACPCLISRRGCSRGSGGIGSGSFVAVGPWSAPSWVFRGGQAGSGQRACGCGEPPIAAALRLGRSTR